MKQDAWYADWQVAEHARNLDARAVLPARGLQCNFERFSDVLLLNERLEALQGPPMLEIGCATGEFYRYMRLKHPDVAYTGLDISEPAILRAREKYPKGRFFLSDPGQRLLETLRASRLAAEWPVLYTKDVMHHQTDPFGFLAQMLEVCTDSLILRTRTRDKGPTVLDAEISCQYHYQGWMPYIVLNIDELISQLQRLAPGSELLLIRNHQVLGGKENRYLPRECYLPETGTAETAVGVFRHSPHRNRVRVIDKREVPPRTPWPDRLQLFLKRGRGTG